MGSTLKSKFETQELEDREQSAESPRALFTPSSINKITAAFQYIHNLRRTHGDTKHSDSARWRFSLVLHAAEISSSLGERPWCIWPAFAARAQCMPLGPDLHVQIGAGKSASLRMRCLSFLSCGVDRGGSVNLNLIGIAALVNEHSRESNK